MTTSGGDGAPARTVVVTQSNYVPWRGWFEMLGRANCWVVLDSVQYTRRDWRNRNRIKTKDGLVWLTIPVRPGNHRETAIDEVLIDGVAWIDRHIETIRHAYRKAKHFPDVMPWLEAQFLAAREMERLSAFNVLLAQSFLARLGVDVAVRRDTDLLGRDVLSGLDPTQRLVRLAEAVGAERYVTGPAARGYMDETAFAARSISVEWMDYGLQEPYPQLWGEFEPAVSIIDLMMNLGDDAPEWIGRRGPSAPGN